MSRTEEKQIFWSLIGELFRRHTQGNRKYVAHPLNEINPNGGENIRNQIIRRRYPKLSERFDDEVILKVSESESNSVTLHVCDHKGEIKKKDIEVGLIGYKQIQDILNSTVPFSA